MISKLVLKILATGALDDLKRIRLDMIENSFNFQMLAGWAHVETSVKFDDYTNPEAIQQVLLLIAKAPEYFDLPALPLAGVSFDVGQMLQPPIIEIRGDALIITPPKATVGGAVITPESIKIYRVDGYSLIDEAEYPTKTSPGQITHKVKVKGVYCVVGSNLLGFGIPARNVEVK